MPKTSLADQCGISVAELRHSFVMQLPTVAALIYSGQDGLKDEDAAAEEAIDLVDALLEQMIEVPK